MIAKTMFAVQDGPANALALSKDYNQVVIAGRNVFKVFSIEEDEFVESCNLRVGKNLNLNFSCNDVAWSPHEDNVLATAATNGAVVVWNLNRPGRSKQEHVFVDHKRTVNKVSFHALEQLWLISGSQDGTMKTFDLRIKEATRTFFSNTESVRDVQFSPHSHHTFAAVSENGTVQQWDLRRPDKYYHQFTAHNGPVFACDWHPETTWLATASRDKTIKVWDMSVKPMLEYTINTIASVGRVKWRPQRKFHIASVALVVDCSVNVWDIRRPYIPFAAFNEHKDVATAIAWRGDPHVFLSTSRDCTLYQHVFKDASRPASKANPQSVAFNSQGELAYACKNSYNGSKTAKLQGILRRTPTSSEEFCHAGSSLYWYSKYVNREQNCLLECAKRYILCGKTLADLCDHNAAVSRELGRLTVSLLWSMIKSLYTARVGEFSLQTPSRDDQSVRDNVNSTERRQEGSEGETAVDTSGDNDENNETEFDDIIDKKPSRKLRIGNLKSAKDSLGDFFFGDNEMDPLSMDFEQGNSIGLTVDTIIPDWTLPVEAFPLRHEIKDRSPPPEQFPNSDSPDPAEGYLWKTCLVKSSSISEQQLMTIEDPSSSLLTVNWVCRVPTWDPSSIVVAALKHHASAGDVQTAASVLLALGDRRKSLYAVLDEATQEHWLLAYIDLLSRQKLWDVATQVIQLSWLPSVYQLNQQSTTMYTGCARCNKPLLRSGWLCDRCHTANSSICSVCHQVVKGLYVWCQGCSHGGHLAHIQSWFVDNRVCPTGCGHECEYT